MIKIELESASKALALPAIRGGESSFFATTPKRNNFIDENKDKLQVNDYYAGGRPSVEGKRYPGKISYITQRAMAKDSHTVTAIITERTQQVSKLPIVIVPKDRREPSRQLDVLNYKSFDLGYHPALDIGDVGYLKEIYRIIDPYDSTTDKRKLFEDKKPELLPNQISVVERLQKKHDEFYKKRDSDIRRIEGILNRPDPFFTNIKSWRGFVSPLIDDILTLDRGAFVKIRDQESGEIIGLMVVDGSYIFPIVNEFGFADPEKAYVQDTGRNSRRYLKKDDVVILSMHPTTDINYFGYGKSPMETLYQSVLAEIHIMKGQVDYYRKGGTLPEIILNLKPPAGKDGTVNQLDQEKLDDLQRRVSSALLSDTTQIAMIAGLDAQILDIKGNRRDGMYEELANFVIRNICAVYQSSPQNVGMVDGIKQSDSETQADMTKQKGLLTLMSVISEEITAEVIDELRTEQDLKLWFDDDDAKYNKQAWDVKKGMIDANVLTVNEFRAQLGSQPVPWGDVPMQGVQMWESPEVTDAKNAQDSALGGLPGGPEEGPPLPGMGGGLPEQEGASEAPGMDLMKSWTPPVAPPRRNQTTEEEVLKDFSFADFNLTPKEAYKRFSERVLKSEIFFEPGISEDEILPLGKEVNGKFFAEKNGKSFLVKAFAESVYAALTPAQQKTLSELAPSSEIIAIERVLLEQYPVTLKSALEENYYKHAKNFSPLTLERVKRTLGK